MKKGKTLTALVLVLEITTISVLHAVKLNHSEKTGAKEISRNNTPEPVEAKQRSIYSLAIFR